MRALLFFVVLVPSGISFIGIFTTSVNFWEPLTLTVRQFLIDDMPYYKKFVKNHIRNCLFANLFICYKIFTLLLKFAGRKISIIILNQVR